MSTKKNIKLLLRSRSWSFMKNCNVRNFSKEPHILIWRDRAVYYRPGSSDTELIYKILLKSGHKSEYWVPRQVDPKVILDIGGNIGVATIYFADRFKNADIHAIEPIPENYTLLVKNTADYQNITSHPIALGNRGGMLEMSHSDCDKNFGGYSFHGLGVDEKYRTKVEMASASDFISRIGIRRVDLLKIDTEGSEYDIIMSIDKEILSSIKWIVGELHGVRDFEVLAYLSNWFHIAMKKTMKNRLFMFHACNKKIAGHIAF